MPAALPQPWPLPAFASMDTSPSIAGFAASITEFAAKRTPDEREECAKCCDEHDGQQSHEEAVAESQLLDLAAGKIVESEIPNTIMPAITDCWRNSNSSKRCSAKSGPQVKRNRRHQSRLSRRRRPQRRRSRGASNESRSGRTRPRCASDKARHWLPGCGTQARHTRSGRSAFEITFQSREKDCTIRRSFWRRYKKTSTHGAPIPRRRQPNPRSSTNRPHIGSDAPKTPAESPPTQIDTR